MVTIDKVEPEVRYTRSTGKLVDIYTNRMRCRICGREWYGMVKWGRYARGSKCCPSGCTIRKGAITAV